MWFLKKRNKIFLEEFSFEIFKAVFENEINNKVVKSFHTSVYMPELTKYLSDDQIKAIYLEIYSIIIYFNYPHKLCLRLEESMKSYVLDVENNDFLYQYILNDFNTALSEEVSKSYSRNEAIALIEQRFQLFKSYINLPKPFGGTYDETVIARVLNRMGAKKRDIDKYLLAISLQLFKNEDYTSFTKEEMLSLKKLLTTYYTDLNEKVSKVKLF